MYSLSDLQNGVRNKPVASAVKPALPAPVAPIVTTTLTPIPVAEITTIRSKQEFTTLKPLNVASCGGCAIPSTTKSPPGQKPSSFQFQTPEFQKPVSKLIHLDRILSYVIFIL